MKPTLHDLSAPHVVGDGESQVQRKQVEPVTPESIHRAREAQLRERQIVEQATGIRIADSGRLLTPLALADDLELGLRLANWCFYALNGATSKQ